MTYLIEVIYKAADTQEDEPQISAHRDRQAAADFVNGILMFARPGEETIIRLKVVEF